MTPTPDQLKTTRRMAGLSQSALAAMLHVSVGTIGAWEAGRRAMPAWQYSFLLWSLAHMER